MATIIEQIIAIDQDAQKRLDEASRFKDTCAEEAQKQIADMTRRIEEETAQKLAAVEREEQEKAQREQTEISHSKEEALRRLQAQYEQTKDTLAQDLFSRVIQ